MTLSLANTISPLNSFDRLRVLIVDDDAGCARELADAVADMGVEARVCLRSADVLSTVHAFDPSLVLLDLDMPGTSGYDIAKAIRAQKDRRITKLIALSGYADPSARRETAKAGFDLHLAKPIKLSLLEEMLELFQVSAKVH